MLWQRISTDTEPHQGGQAIKKILYVGMDVHKESITIAASKVPTFKAGKAFKDAVAE